MSEPPLIDEDRDETLYTNVATGFTEEQRLLCSTEEAERADAQQVRNGRRVHKKSYLDSKGNPVPLTALTRRVLKGWIL